MKKIINRSYVFSFQYKREKIQLTNNVAVYICYCLKIIYVSLTKNDTQTNVDEWFISFFFFFFLFLVGI